MTKPTRRNAHWARSAGMLGLFALLWCDQILLAGFMKDIWAGTRLRREIANRDEAAIALISKNRALASALKPDTLTQFEHHELERLRSLEDKAKASLIGIALAFSLLGIGVTIWFDNSGPLTQHPQAAAVVSGSIVLGAFYFLVGGLYAFQALSIGTVYRVTPEDHAAADKEWLLATRLFYLAQNERKTILRTNALSVSLVAMRNGIVALAIGTLYVSVRLMT